MSFVQAKDCFVRLSSGLAATLRPRVQVWPLTLTHPVTATLSPPPCHRPVAVIVTAAVTNVITITLLLIFRKQMRDALYLDRIQVTCQALWFN